jgi:hypothetical protein
MMTMIRPVEEVEAMCGLPPEEVKEDNVVSIFGEATVDNTYDPFAH